MIAVPEAGDDFERPAELRVHRRLAARDRDMRIPERPPLSQPLFYQVERQKEVFVLFRTARTSINTAETMSAI
jgi:hypothetical protein